MRNVSVAQWGFSTMNAAATVARKVRPTEPATLDVSSPSDSKPASRVNLSQYQPSVGVAQTTRQPEYDVFVIGGGITGSALVYQLAHFTGEKQSMVVIQVSLHINILKPSALCVFPRLLLLCSFFSSESHRIIQHHYPSSPARNRNVLSFAFNLYPAWQILNELV